MVTYKPGDMPVPDYKVESFLGEGGYGCVYKVVNTKTGIAKALKCITLRDTQGYKEYQALALFKEIRNPYLIPIEHYWLKDEHNREIKFSEDESLNIAGRGVVELLILLGLGDKSLLDRLKQCVAETGTGIPLDELMDYMNDIAKAIDFLNLPKSIGDRENVAIQHGDIKPGNVMMVGNGVQVGDYGLAQAISVTPEAGKSRTTTGSMAGTPEYAAPEQVGGKSSRSSDQYSLAISYYEMRTGKLPFDDQANRYACLASDGLDFSMVPPDEQAVLHRATARQFAQRYPTCIEFVRALKKAQNTGPLPPRQDSITPIDIGPLTPQSRPILELLKPGSEDFLTGFQLIDRVGIDNEEELWRVFDIQEKQYALLKLIRGVNPSRAFDEYNLFYKLRNITHERILNIQRLWVVDRFGKEFPSDQVKQPNVLVDKLVLVLMESAEKTLEEHITELKQNPYSERLKRKWFDFISHLRFGSDYWNNYCGQGYCDLNPASILVNKYDQIKIDSARISKYLSKAGTGSSQLADSFSFRAPELYESGHAKESDQYSLAMIYYWLCTGETFFPVHFKPADIKHYIGDGYLDFTKELPEEAAVLSRATLLDPGQRYTDSVEFIQAFEVALKITSIESWNAQAFQQRISQIQEAQAKQASNPLLETPPVIQGIAQQPSRGQSIQFPGEEELVTLTKETNSATRKSTPGHWKKPTDKELKAQTVVEPVKPVPVDDQPFDLDDDERRSSKWPIRILMSVLLLAVFAGTMIALNWNRHSGNAGTTTSPIQSTIVTPTIPTPDPVVNYLELAGGATEDGTQGGSKLIKALPPPPDPKEAWVKDYNQLLDKVQTKKTRAELGKLIADETPVLLKTYESYPEAIETIKSLTQFVSLLNSHSTVLQKPLAEQVTWLKSYQEAKAAVSKELSTALTSHTKELEAGVVKQAEALVPVADLRTNWSDRQKFLETARTFVSDPSFNKLLGTAIAESAIEAGDKSIAKVVPDKDDAFSNYVAALQLSRAPKPEFTAIVPLLQQALPTPATPPAIIADSPARSKAVREILAASLKSFRTSSVGFASFKENNKRVSSDVLHILCEMPGIGENKLQTMELAMLHAQLNDPRCLVSFKRVPGEYVQSSTLSLDDKAKYLVQYCKAVKQHPCSESDKVAAHHTALNFLVANDTEVPVEDIAETIINPCLQLGVGSIGSDDEKVKLSESLFKYHMKMLDAIARWYAYCADKKLDCSDYLYKVTSFAGELDPKNEAARAYSMLHRFNVIDPRISYSNKQYRELRSEWRAFLDKCSSSMKETKLFQHLESRMYLHDALIVEDEDDKEIERDGLLKKALKAAELSTDSIFDSKMNKHDVYYFCEHAGYVYNATCNYTKDSIFRKKYYDASIAFCDKCIQISSLPKRYVANLYSLKGINLEDKGFFLGSGEIDSFKLALEAYDKEMSNANEGDTEASDKASLNIGRCNYRYAVAFRNLKKSDQARPRIDAALTTLRTLIIDANTGKHVKIEASFFIALIDYEKFVHDNAGLDPRGRANALFKIINSLNDALDLSGTTDNYYERNVFNELCLKSTAFMVIFCSGTKGNGQYFTDIYALPPSEERDVLMGYHDKIKDTVEKRIKQFRIKYSKSTTFLQGANVLFGKGLKDRDWIISDKCVELISMFYQSDTSQYEDIRKYSVQFIFLIAKSRVDCLGLTDFKGDKQAILDDLSNAAKTYFKVYKSFELSGESSSYLPLVSICDQLYKLHKTKSIPAILTVAVNLSNDLYQAYPDNYTSELSSKQVLAMINYAAEAASNPSNDSKMRDAIKPLLQKHLKLIMQTAKGQFLQEIEQIDKKLSSVQ